MAFENEDILPKFIEEQTTRMAMQYKTNPATGRTVYRCHNDFGPLDLRGMRKMIPKITDFGLATPLESGNGQVNGTARTMGIYPIQPDHYRAPEVILGCGWTFSTDIWNFGVLVRMIYFLEYNCNERHLPELGSAFKGIKI